MPPTIGAAMRCMTSEPVPWLHMIGTSPATMTATVIALGRTRSTAPSRIACINAAPKKGAIEKKAPEAYAPLHSGATSKV